MTEPESPLAGQVRSAHAEALVSQALLVGLMLAARKRGVDIKIFEEAFEFAADVSIRSSYLHGGSDLGQSARVLEALDQLRKAVIPPQKPA